ARAIIIPSRIDYSKIPIEFEKWRGETLESNARITEATGADLVEDRVYRLAGQEDVYVHFGSWVDPESRAPHLPQSCYSESGWKLIKEKTEKVTLRKSSEAPITAALLTWDGEKGQIRTLHWYTRGSLSFVDWEGGCDAYRQLWGRSEWPAIDKVLMQTPNDDPDRAKDRIVDLAERISGWIQQVQ
ncbi:MAG: exosortase-associated EpsI family protein, partial [Planctomycetaceae bacterium]